VAEAGRAVNGPAIRARGDPRVRLDDTAIVLVLIGERGVGRPSARELGDVEVRLRLRLDGAEGAVDLILIGERGAGSPGARQLGDVEVRLLLRVNRVIVRVLIGERGVGCPGARQLGDVEVRLLLRLNGAKGEECGGHYSCDGAPHNSAAPVVDNTLLP